MSHETIYRTLFVQSRGALRQELTANLRTGRVIRRPKGTRLPDGRGARPGIVNISDRPAEAADRAVPGHWEGDLVFGTRHDPGRHPGRALDPVLDAGRTCPRATTRPTPSPTPWPPRSRACPASCAGR